jgi:MFS family permease
MLFLSVLAPLLPTYVDRLGLNDAEAGLLSSAYAWGAVVAAFPSALLAQKLGPRKLISWSLVALSVTTFVYAWAEQVAVLDLSRFAQGLCGAAVWSGAMTWLMDVVPKGRKGAAIGTVASAGGIGALIGPIAGAIGVAVGPRWLFSALPAMLLLLCVAVATTTSTPRFETQSVRAAGAAFLRRPLVDASLFLSAPTLGFGLIAVVAPLKMHEFGGSASLIAGSFIAAAVAEALLAPIAGHWSDRSGRRSPYLAGLIVFCVGLALMAAASSLLVVVLVPPLCSVGGGLFISPAFAHLSDAAEHSGMPQSHAFALATTAFAVGLAVGSLFGGAIAGIGGTETPLLVLIAFLLVLAAYAKRGRALAPRITAA